MSDKHAIYLTSFPPLRYRRPLLASQALKLLGVKTKIYLGWDLVNKYKTLKAATSLSNLLPPPINWLCKDTVYDAAIYTTLPKNHAALCINMNTIGVLALKALFREKVPLIIDCQDVTIQDDGSIPFYDQRMIELADLVIFASRAIKTLAEKNHPKLLKRATYVPFGIELQQFDKHYMGADPQLFRSLYGLKENRIITYSGAAYLWGRREGQGLELLLDSVQALAKSTSSFKLIIQGAAAPSTPMWKWVEVQVRKRGLENHTILLPPMAPYEPVRMSLFKASNALVLPIGDILGTYYAEQQKLFEYMAAQRPIVMVATPARLNVLDPDSAFIARRRDPEEFALEILRALNEKEDAETKAQRARRIVEQYYDWQKLIPKYAKAVAPLIDQ